MNISKFHDCYGCGVCAKVCSKQIIDIVLNKNGFYEPLITDNEKCTDCGLCVEVCSYWHNDLASVPQMSKGYAAWSQDEEIRYRCSSGGFVFELGRKIMEKGYNVCAVRYNIDTNRAEHFIAHTAEDLIPSIGSKYIQSYFINGLKEINRNEKYLVIGTPCQIDSFRRYIRLLHREEQFLLLDFFCHGVPSMWVWRKYLQRVKKKTGIIFHVAWRNKLAGWHDSWAMVIKGEKAVYNSKWTQKDLFYNLYLDNVCLGKACYEKCKFKQMNSAADLRIGDFWGKTYQMNEEGVNAVLVFTEKGEQALALLDNVQLVSKRVDITCEGQMNHAPLKPMEYDFILSMLRNPYMSLSNTYKVIRCIYLYKRIKNKLLK